MRNSLPSFASSWPLLAAVWLLAPTGAALAQTTTFSYTGAAQTYTVPAGVTRLQVTADGGAGGIYSGNTQPRVALGARVSATLTVVAGQVLTVTVGGQGVSGRGATFAGGYNGGGTGTDSGSGGGATDLRRASANGATGDYDNTRNAMLVAAGAGGSARGNRDGGGGGQPGGGGGSGYAGELNGGGNGGGVGVGQGGGGGSQTAVGGSGSGAGPATGNQGGAGLISYGGGGGGGYYGGGGGRYAGGGGGGSWAMPGSTSSVYSTVPTVAAGQLTIVIPCAPPVAVAQNGVVSLDAAGAVAGAVAGAALNNGSTANCGPAPASALSSTPSSFGCADVVPATATSSLSFNGSTQYVQGTNALLPLGNAPRTIETWVYPTAANANGVIFNYGTPSSNQRSGLILSSGRLYYVGENNDLVGTTVLSANVWHHVAATYDGATLKLYVDGVLDVSSAPASGAFNTTGTIWRIAQRSSPQTGEFLAGRIDEVRVWSVARTAAQISANKGVGLPGSSAGLVAYYRLNEGSGTTTADGTGVAANVGTLFNSPTWSATGPPVVNGVLATLTVTDLNNQTSTASATILTVLDNTAPAPYLLPVAPALALANVPEAAGYGLLYQLNLPDVATFNSSGVPYLVNNAGLPMATPTRVAYFMELTSTAGTKWVWASMDNFATTLAQLGFPNPTSNNVTWHQSVANLNVFSSAGAGVATGSSLGTGRIEMWPWNYGPANADNVAGGDGTTFDFSDQPDYTNNYGSFQVHNLTTPQTVLAYNNWGGGGIGDIGIGNQVGGSGQPDWTFQNNANTYSVKRISILVPNSTSTSVAFTQSTSVALDVNGNASITPPAVYLGNAVDCGTVTATVTPSTFTCANIGTNTVTVTLSDGRGNTSSQPATVTVTVPTTPTATWTGSLSTNGLACQNWTYGQVPNATTNVVVPPGLTLYPNLTTGTLATKDLTINGSLTVASGATLQVNGNFANNTVGTVSLPGTVAFVGSAATQALGGSAATAFTTVTVNKPAGTVQLGSDLAIGTALTMTTGTLSTTANYKVALGAAATVTETNTSYIIGKVALTRSLTAGTAETFGGVGLTLTPATTGFAAPGSTLVTRTTGTALAGAGTSQSILRYFNIQPTVNAGLSVKMDFTYLPHELNFTLGTLGLFKSVNGGTPWVPQRPITVAGTTVTKTGITDFSVWTLGNADSPLPVELLTFTATAEGHAAVRLAWATASEKNSAYFDVERSRDGTAFERVGTVAAAGSSTAPRHYAQLDGQLPAGAATLYYRLRQVDVDGAFNYSLVQSVALAGPAGPALFPNPAHTAATFTGAVPGTLVRVFDALGRQVASAPADAAGTATLALPAGLPAGVYVVRAGATARRLVVE